MDRFFHRISPGARHMLLSTVFFSAMSVFAKVAGQRLPVAEVVLARVAVALVLCWWALRGLGINPWGKNRPLLLARGIFGFGALCCYFYALSQLPLADATVIQFTNPMLTALLAAVVLREGLSFTDILATLTAIVGVILIAQPSFLFADGASLDPFAVGIAFAGAFLAACAYVVIRRLAETEHHLVVVLYFPLVAGPASIPLLAAGDVVVPSGVDWLLLLGVGVMAQLGQVQMTKGYKLEPARYASAITYLQIVWAYAWGVLLFSEYPNRLSLLGAALVVGSVVGVMRRR